jgi:hypothetical protein
MIDLDTSFEPDAMLGIGILGWIALGLGSLLVWGWIAALAWRMVK